MDGQLSLFESDPKPIKPKKKKPIKRSTSPDQTHEERMKRFWHYWNNKTAYENQIETCVGELRIIVDALADYSDYASGYIEKMEHGYSKAAWENRIKKIKEIQGKIELSIGYNRDEQLIKCQKIKEKKVDDIGEDALILALK